MVKKYRFKPIHQVASIFRTASGERLCVKTIRRVCHANGIRNYNAVSKPYLTKKHVASRLNWAVTRRNWMVTDWGNVMFSDESSFTIRPTKLRARVWRKEGTRYNPDNLVPTFKSGYVSLSVWGGFSMYGRTPLVRIEGNLNQSKYRKIIEGYVMPFASKNHGNLRNFVYQQDGCAAHRAKSIIGYLDANGIEVLPWPAQSPDLNPIEHVWAIMKKQLRERATFPSNADSLFCELCSIWNALSDDYFHSLVQSMPRRVAAVIKNEGCSTKY